MIQKDQQTKTVGLFQEETHLHYIDGNLVIATSCEGPVVVLKNGSSKSLGYALKLSGFGLKKGGAWMKRPDGLSYHLLEARREAL